jgi:hypothetical protein
MCEQQKWCSYKEQHGTCGDCINASVIKTEAETDGDIISKFLETGKEVSVS